MGVKHRQRHRVPGRWHHTEFTARRTTRIRLSQPTCTRPPPSVYWTKKKKEKCYQVGQKFTLWLACEVKYSATVALKQGWPNPVLERCYQAGFSVLPPRKLLSYCLANSVHLRPSSGHVLYLCCHQVCWSVVKSKMCGTT